MMLAAYAQGIFPMAEGADDPQLYWMEPRRRGIIPLRAAPLMTGGGFHTGRSLRRSLRRKLGREGWRVSCDRAFDQVIAGCADRSETWINTPIRQAFGALHRLGHAHSIEVWDGDGQLAGGLYGLALGGAFFAESMFSQRSEASKIALTELVARLEHCRFLLLDTQYLTDHLASLGGIEISRVQYLQLLSAALPSPVRHDLAFAPENPSGIGGAYWQDNTQTS
ncbi:MAG: leucyl/phenylalanyl-tRNA--protein transferase [Pararhodobacter sp.]